MIPATTPREKNALKEIIQEIALAGLSRGGFFDRAAFYKQGENARVFKHGMNRRINGK